MSTLTSKKAEVVDAHRLVLIHRGPDAQPVALELGDTRRAGAMGKAVAAVRTRDGGSRDQEARDDRLGHGGRAEKRGSSGRWDANAKRPLCKRNEGRGKIVLLHQFFSPISPEIIK